MERKGTKQETTTGSLAAAKGEEKPVSTLRPLDSYQEAIARYLGASVASSTVDAYRSDLRDLAEFLSARGLPCTPPIDPATLCLYLVHLADDRELAASTLERRLAAVSKWHEAEELPSPSSSREVRALMRGIRRELGTARTPALPLLVDDLKLIVSRIDGDDLIDVRDRALLLVGWACALRRSEIAALDVSDLVPHQDLGLRVRIRRSKTDQEGRGQEVALYRYPNNPFCPVQAVEAWISRAKLQEETGALFRPLRGYLGAHRVSDFGRMRGQDVSRVLKKGCPLLASCQKATADIP